MKFQIASDTIDIGEVSVILPLQNTIEFSLTQSR